MSLLKTLGLLAVAYFLAKLVLGRRKRTSLPYPPGPPSEPLIGHARLIASAYRHEPDVFHELGKKYGGIVFMSALGNNVAIINDAQIAEELLDARGSTYCSRPSVPVAELIGVTQALPFMEYGDDFKRHRKMFQRYFRQDRAHEHRPIQLRETQILLRNLATTPGDFSNHIFQYGTAIIIEIAFGHIIADDNDPYVEIAVDFCKYVVPTLMNSDPVALGLGPLFPILQYFPPWFPLAYYPSTARSVKKYAERFYSYPFADVKDQLERGVVKPSFLTTQLDEVRSGEADSALSLKDVQGAAAIVYLAGAETTSNTLMAIIAAMLLYPDYQKKVHAEIDKAIGPNRLPEFSDRDNLPYLEHFLQETTRWHPIVPLHPHQSIRDDVYNGMFIPKGTMVISNGRGICLDKNVYHDPHTFNPDRYLPKPAGRGEPYPASTWGFGRRVCPGRYLASDSVWIAAARIFATMVVKEALGPDGKGVTPDIKFAFGGSTSHPEPFECRIEPRNDLARRFFSGGLHT